MPTIVENNTSNNSISQQYVVGAGIPTPPPQASAAGLNTLFFRDDFDTLSFYHPTNNPNGTWRFNDFYQNASEAGYVDFAGSRTFMINQMAPTAETTPYLPASQPEASVMRLACRRARLSERPALRTLVNNIAASQDPGLVDRVTWLGAFLTTEKVHPLASSDITRPAYIEARLRFTPANTQGIFSSFWVYDTSEVAGTPEIDIFETNDTTPAFWKTNIHHTATGPDFNIQHNSAWCDGNWHTFGMLWQASSLDIYRDNILSGSLSGSNAGFFSMPLRLMITHTCDPAYQPGVVVPLGIEQANMDVDFINVWK